MACPSDEVLAQFMAATAAPSDAEPVAVHLSSCARCRDVAEMLASTSPGLAPPTEPTAESHAPAEILQRGSRVGRFVILEQVGAGGMGVVYAAFDPLLERKVALKLLRLENIPTEAMADARTRLLREAQAIARLAHPNVVTVFDAGTFGDGVFVAMEFVEGSTLLDWLTQSRRSPREVLPRFLAAATGLAAAHGAGLVHRDFKPGNVLLGEDGRVRVVDFGLVRTTEREPDHTVSASGLSPVQRIEARLTVVGAVMGTPAYMAPEQITGGEVDGRTDQFSFCVSLYEALYGVRPYPPAMLPEGFARIREGRIEPPQRTSGVPRRIARILARGLSFERERRHPSMDALIDALESAMRRGRLQRLVPVGAAAAVLATAGWLTTRDAGAVCGGAPEAIASTWSADRRARVADRWRELGTTAGEAQHRVFALLDEYARRWIGAHTQACEATRVHREQPEEVLTRRMVCLEHRRRELDAVVHTIEGLTAEKAHVAFELATSLRPLGACDAPEVMARGDALTPPPELQAPVERLRGRLADVFALRMVNGPQALKEAEALVADARRLGFAPILAEALDLLGRLQSDVPDPAAARASLHEALVIAERAGADELRLRAQSDLARVLSFRQSLHDEANLVLERAEAVLDRIGRPVHEDADHALLQGLLQFQQGQYEPAVRSFERALALEKRLYGEDHPRPARTLNNLAQAQKALGQLTEAEANARRSADLLTARVGPEHRWTRTSRYSSAIMLLRLARYEEALEALRRVLPNTVEGRPTDEDWTLQVRMGLARVQLDQLSQAGQILEGLEAWREATRSKEPGADNEIADLRATLAHARGDLDAALQGYRAQHLVSERRLGKDAVPTLDGAGRLIGLLLDRGEREKAAAQLAEIRADADRVLPPDYPLRGQLLAYEAELLLEDGRAAEAKARALEAIGRLERFPSAAPILTRARFSLLRALSALNAADEERASIRRTLMRDLGTASPWNRWLRARLETWERG